MENLRIEFASKILPVKPINDQMTLCKCYIMSPGKNVNKTNISKEAVEDAVPTLYNIPVVGHIFVDEENNMRMGGHDMALERDQNGKLKFKMLTVPYGTVPQQDNVHFEEIEDDKGNKVAYQVADVILWTGRYPELLDAKYSDEIYYAQSMEITPIETDDDGEYLNINKFQYSALCLLGKSDDKSKNVRPCFELSRVEPYQYSANDGEVWATLFEEFKEELAKTYTANIVEKGGKDKMNTELIKSILLEFGLDENTELKFEVSEEMTEEQFRAKMKEAYEGDAEPASDSEPITDTEPTIDSETTTDSEPVVDLEPAVEPEADPNPVQEPVKFEIERTYEEKRKAMCEALDINGHWDENSYESYYLEDFTEDSIFYYFHKGGKDIEETSGYMKTSYTTVDEKIVIDFKNAQSVRKVWLTKEDEDKLAEQKKEYDELVEYKKKRQCCDRQNAYAEAIKNFEDLSEIDEYKEVVKNCLEFSSVEELTEKLYAIRGKYAKPQKKPIGSMRFPINFEAKENKNEEMSAFMAKYLKK